MWPFGGRFECTGFGYFTSKAAPFSKQEEASHNAFSQLHVDYQMTRCRNVQIRSHGTRGECSQTGLLAMTSARGPGEGLVSRAIASDDEFCRKLISVNPWNVTK